MVRAKTWLVIPALAVIAAGLALAGRHAPETVICVGALGAALAAAVRAFTGPSGAGAVAASAASLLGVLALLELRDVELARAALASAAGLFAIAELVRPLPPDASPWPALGAALVASVLDPAFATLLAVAGVRYMTGPWPQPRWAPLVPAVGVIACALAATTLVLQRDYQLASDLWALWAARPVHAPAPLATLLELGDLLGPVTAVVALAGLGTCALRGRIPAAAMLGVFGGALAIDLVAATGGSVTLAIAAVAAGCAIARFAAMIRWPVGQAFVGAAVGFMLVAAPLVVAGARFVAWTSSGDTSSRPPGPAARSSRSETSMVSTSATAR